MKPIEVVLPATGTSKAIAMDRYISPFNVSLGLSAGAAGGGAFTVQHAFDDYYNPPPGGPSWFNHAFLVNAPAGTDGNYAFPVSQIRLVCSTAAASAGTLVITQAGLR